MKNLIRLYFLNMVGGNKKYPGGILVSMNTKHVPLVVAIALPVIFVLILAAVILIPNMSVKPQHDFLYTSPDAQLYGYYNGNIQYKNTYDLKEDKVVLKPQALPSSERKDPYAPVITYENAPPIYYYDIKTEASREITLEEAQKFSLQKGPSSPDGYTISYNTNHDGAFELFGSEDTSAYVISNGKGKKSLSGIVNSDMYYRAELNIIGWIK